MAALTELCELLSLSSEEALGRSFQLDAFCPLLVACLQSETNPDVALLAARALTHLAEVFPAARGAVVAAGALPALIARLLTIEYIDLAEQCLTALEKLGREHGAACVRAGGMAATLSYLDFFSLSLQRTAAAAAAHMARGLPEELHESALEAAPALGQLLGSGDERLAEQGCLALRRLAASMEPHPARLARLVGGGLLARALALLASAADGGAAAQAGPSPLATASVVSLLAAAARAVPDAAAQLLEQGAAGVVRSALAPAAARSRGEQPRAQSAPLLAPETLADLIALAAALAPPPPAAAAGASPPAPSTPPLRPAAAGRGRARSWRPSGPAAATGRLRGRS